MVFFINQSLLLSFRLYDWVSGWLTKHFFVMKTGLLLGAHGRLFGFFFPELRWEFLVKAITFVSSHYQAYQVNLLPQFLH